MAEMSSEVPTLNLFEINRGQNYFLRLSVLVVEIVPSVLRWVISLTNLILLNSSIKSLTHLRNHILLVNPIKGRGAGGVFMIY